MRSRAARASALSTNRVNNLIIMNPQVTPSSPGGSFAVELLLHRVLEDLVIFLGVHCKGGVEEGLHTQLAMHSFEFKLGSVHAQHTFLVLLVDG